MVVVGEVCNREAASPDKAHSHDNIGCSSRVNGPKCRVNGDKGGKALAVMQGAHL